MDLGAESARGLFAGVDEFPDQDAAIRYRALVGIEDLKHRLVRHAEIILNPRRLAVWAERYRLENSTLLSEVARRPPLLIFAGDVGTGKSALAESFGDEVSRTSNIPITLYRLSLSARGSGAVGEMTQLLSAAFEEVRTVARRLRSTGGGDSAGGVVLVIDEADALAQSRELAQMHHEDRAGVNELIRGIDDLGRDAGPALVVMCTNRLSALDPAIRRRAAETFMFDRPNEVQRRKLLSDLFSSGMSESDLEELVTVTGPRQGFIYGYTFSDITHRLTTSIVLDAYPDKPLNGQRIVTLARELVSSPPFESETT
jgi:SpoVK/Ycf46/Vps4 family AAA+-type ATPase